MTMMFQRLWQWLPASMHNRYLPSIQGVVVVDSEGSLAVSQGLMDDRHKEDDQAWDGDSPGAVASWRIPLLATFVERGDYPELSL